MNESTRVALVTGAARGIGLAIALRLARDRVAIVLADRRTEELRSADAEVERLGVPALAVSADVSDSSQVPELIKQAELTFGRIDILINNAAIVGPTAPVERVTREEWDEVLAVNLTSAFLCAKAVLPAMKARRSGKIVNIASVAGKSAYALRAPYAASKSALIGLTLTLAKEVGEFQIQVNAICPGPVEGERMRLVIRDRAAELGQKPAQVERTYREATALNQLVRQDDVAELAGFLASPAADRITGQAIDVSAGYGL